MPQQHISRFWLVGLLSLASSPVLAVDTTLHNLPAILDAQYAAYVVPGSQAATIDPTLAITGLSSPSRRGDAAEPPEDLWQRIRNGFAMPDLDGPLVVERQAWYAARPQQIKIMVERSRLYLFYIVRQLERRGMPTELALLPMVESAFNPMAYSRANASGLWQFIPSTGKNYNLDQNWWYDGRRDIVASTQAALDYLQNLHEMFGDWQLALAAYNWGENAVTRAIERNRAKGLPTDYESLDMPAETRSYVPKLQALKNLVLHPEANGIELDPIPNAPYFVTVTLTHDIDLRIAARLAEMPVEDLVKLNPAHNRPVVAMAIAPTLVLPADRAEVFRQNLEQHDKPLSNWQTYTVQSGDRIEKLAAKYGLTVARFKAINGLGAQARIGPGTQVLVPLKGANAEPLPGQFRAAPEPEGRTVVYTVRRGDTVSGIARTFRLPPADVQRVAGKRLTAGEKLTLTIPARDYARGAVKPAKGGAHPDQVARRGVSG